MHTLVDLPTYIADDVFFFERRLGRLEMSSVPPSMERDLFAAAKGKVDSYKPAELREMGFFPRDGSYFPAIYYPPITMYPPSDADRVYEGFEYNGSVPLSLYVHIPFCLSRCRYCHWAVSIGDSSADRDRYLDFLEKELGLYATKLGVGRFAPTSILIGGGTPSMLSAPQLKRLFTILHVQLDLSRCTQMTIETEPVTITGHDGLAKLRVIKDGGVDRVSLGIQAFDDEVLESMGRAHQSKQAIEAIDLVRRVGIDSLSIDLIYGYPGGTLRTWADTMRTAIDLEVDAYQLYRLRIVPHGDHAGVVLRQHERAPESFPAVTDIRVMKAFASLVSAQYGFVEMSRRVFCRKPEDNSEYLLSHTDRLHDVLGLGVSAWSNLQGRVTLNAGGSQSEYYAHLDEGKLAVNRGKIRTADDNRRWAITLPLKHNGVSKRTFETATGMSVREAFGRTVDRLQQSDLIEEDDTMLRLTEKGRFFADETVIQFYHPDYVPFPRSAYADGVLNPYNAES